MKYICIYIRTFKCSLFAPIEREEQVQSRAGVHLDLKKKKQ